MSKIMYFTEISGRKIVNEMIFTKINIIIISFLIPFILNAQSKNHISGAVFDKASNIPLISASVYYAGNKTLGTITNSDGEFIIEKTEENDSLVFSYIGYGAKRYSINNLPKTIYLEPSAINLQEITITSADWIVMQIWEKYNKIDKANEKNKNKQCSFFYRQFTKTNNTYNEFIECFMTGDNTFYVDNLKLQEGRYAKLKEDTVFTFTNFFSTSQIKPFRQKNPKDKKTINTFIQPNFKTIYNVNIDNRISDKNGDIIVLNFQPKEPNKNLLINTGKLYVRAADFSILRFEGECSTIIRFRGKINSNTMYKTQFQIIYKENTDTYPVIESVTCASSFKIANQDKVIDANVNSTLFAVEQQFDDSGKKLKTNNKLIDVIDKKKYNPEFWKDNPIVKRTKVDEEIIKAFEDNNLFNME